MNVQIVTQHYEVLDSGSVIVPTGEYIEFRIENLKFRVAFEQEQSNANGESLPGRINAHVVGSGPDAYMLITLYNQDTAFFSGMDGMANLGTINHRVLSLKFAVLAINNGHDKIFHYTWFYQLAANDPNTIIDTQTTE